MTEKRWDLGDYVDVPTRMAWFFEQYPDGSLQAGVEVWPTTEFPIFVVRAYAYRWKDDPFPGTGLASEIYPGVTPYTKGSELMNAETSAWGRALAAVGAPIRGKVASADEVRGAQERRITPVPQPKAETEVEQSGPVHGERPQTGPEEQAALPTDHVHTWVQSPTLKKFVVCSDPACRKVVKKDEVAEGVDAS